MDENDTPGLLSAHRCGDLVMRFAHTNIVAKDWIKLADFYSSVFGCTARSPIRRQSGEWLTRGTGVRNASFEGVHLALPGYGDDGPTLEIFQYGEIESSPQGPANRQGFAHIAFEVDDVETVAEDMLVHGGTLEGTITRHPVANVGVITFIYARDPEGNLVEIQSWA